VSSTEIKTPADRYKFIAEAIRKKNNTTELIKPADMPQAILNLISSNSIDFTYKDDNTIELLDKNNIAHILSCTYEDNKLVAISYDSKTIKLGYEGDVLVSVGNTAIDIANAPKTPATNVQTNVQANSCVAQVVSPVVLDTVTVKINSGTVQVDSSASLEE